MDVVNIPAEKTAAALAALYNASHPQGLGFLHATPDLMMESEAAEILVEIAQNSHQLERCYADYDKGRIIKTDFSGGETSLRLFDRDNGPGAGYAALKAAGVVS